VNKMILALCAAAMVSTGSARAAEPIRLTTEDYAPFNFADANGAVVGISTDILRAIGQRADVAFQFELMPWQRAYNEALNKPNTCVYSTTVTEARRGQFNWVSPLVRNDWVVFGRSDAPSPAKSIAEMKGKRVGVYQGDAIEAFFQNETGYVLDSAPRDDLNPQKLSSGRIDYWATGGLLGESLAHKAGVTNVKPLFVFREAELGLACNKVVPETTIKALNAALTALRAEGAVAKIEAKYLAAL